MFGNGNLAIGQYYSVSSFGHRLDPRSKITAVIILMITAVLTTKMEYYLVMTGGIMLALLVSRISPMAILRNLRPFVLLIAITALYHLIFSSRESAMLYSLWGMSLTEGGVYLAISFSLRVLVFVLAAFFISLTTLPSDLAETVVIWLRPLKMLRVPVEDIGLVIFIAMRFIPVLAEEFDSIRKAQMIRGLEFKGSPWRRIKNYIALIIPVFQAALRRADDLAMAIEARGYRSGEPRSAFREFRFRAADWVFLLLSAVLIIGAYFYLG